MKKVILSLIALVAIVAVVLIEGTQTTEAAESNELVTYNHVQEQEVSTGHDSPVIKDTVNQIASELA